MTAGLAPESRTDPAATLRRGVDLSSTDSIRLTVPAASSAVRIARAGAAGLATRAGFTYQEVEQLQLAVGEATALLAPEPDGDGTLVLVFDVEEDGMRIDVRLADPQPSPRARTGVTVPSVAEAVLDAAVDSWAVYDDGRRIVLRKQLSDTGDEDD
jgi:serine/threonine-protein kinase RsbW